MDSIETAVLSNIKFTDDTDFNRKQYGESVNVGVEARYNFIWPLTVKEQTSGEMGVEGMNDPLAYGGTNNQTATGWKTNAELKDYRQEKRKGRYEYKDRLYRAWIKILSRYGLVGSISMGVKTIFKVLIGTIAILLLSMVVIEYINVATFSYQINQLTRLSVKKACDFYSKETYKSNVGLLRDIVGTSGNNVIGGNIYDYNTDEEIYNSLYTNSSDFINWYSQHSGIWDKLDLLAYGLNIGGKIVDGEDALIAKYMADTQVTPINLGVTYLDKDSIEKVTHGINSTHQMGQL